MAGLVDRLRRWCATRARMAVDVDCISECGAVRKDNQDSFLIDRERRFYAVADGMGGGEGGARASAIACEELARACRARTFAARLHAAAEALCEADRRIRAFAASAGYRQMATTAALFHFDGRHLGVVGWIGDSRLYRWRSGRLEQLTADHTLVGELARSTPRPAGCSTREGSLAHVLTRALGVGGEIAPEWRRVDVCTGDRLLLATDGLFDMLDDRCIGEIVGESASASEAVANLAAAVRAAGSADNFTIVAIYAGAASR